MARRLQTKKLCPWRGGASRTGLAARHSGVGVVVAVLAFVGGMACESGLEPPAEPGFGSIEAVISYSGSWPSAAELRDLRFVALRFVPRDTTDLLQLNRMVISGGLARNVAVDTVFLDMVPEGSYVYAGVAQQFSADLFDWRPVGLVDGSFDVLPNATSRVWTNVNFSDLPPFPPPQP